MSFSKTYAGAILGISVVGQFLFANPDEQPGAINAHLAEKAPNRGAKSKESTELKEAIERGFEILRTGVKNYPEHRSCFSCHHQGLPLLALSLEHPSEPNKKPDGFWNSPITKSIREFTEESFVGKRESMREGKGVGGRALTVAYGLWTMDLAGAQRNETIEAMIDYLIRTQADDGAWDFQSLRPPAASSRAMTTAIAIYGLRTYGVGYVDQKRLEAVLRKARAWSDALETPKSHEDIVGLTWLDSMLDTESIASKFDQDALGKQVDPVSPFPEEGKGDTASVIRSLKRKEILLKSQRPDGGWGQTVDMPSDAYATGQALLVLAQVDDDHTHSVQNFGYYLDGIDFLLRTQQNDGSWHVVTRSKPVQVYFDNGDPHEKDQFISMMATSWATAALANHRTGSRDPLESVRVIERRQLARDKAFRSDLAPLSATDSVRSDSSTSR